MQGVIWDGIQTGAGFVGKIIDSFRVQVATAGAGSNYFYTPDDQRNSRRGQISYPSIFGFKIRLTFKNPTYIHSIEHFALESNQTKWVRLENRPRPSNYYSSAFDGFFEGKARGIPERQNIPNDQPYNSVLIDTCYVGYFSDPYHPIRVIDGYDHKDCYSVVQTSNGTFFFYLSLPELNHNVEDASGKIIGEPLYFSEYNASAIDLVGTEAARIKNQFGVDPLIAKRMQVTKRHLNW